MGKIGILVTFLAVGVWISCGTPRTAAEQDARSKKVEMTFSGTPEERLAYHLRRQAGVQVNQNGDNFSAVIRGGVNSFQSNATPLFVVDGQQIGYDFSSAAQIIGQREIARLKVLKGSDATLYGIRGSGGVIEISVKKDN